MGICRRDLNFWIRAEWAARSEGGTVGEGVGGRRESRDFKGSKISVHGYLGSVGGGDL